MYGRDDYKCRTTSQGHLLKVLKQKECNHCKVNQSSFEKTTTYNQLNKRKATQADNEIYILMTRMQD